MSARTCFKCGGSVIREPGIDDEDLVDKCLSCGRFQPLEEAKATTVPTDWRAAALAEYRGILAEPQRVIDLRDKAAQLRQGLLALGLTNVPELPGAAAPIKKLARVTSQSPAWSPEEDERLMTLRAAGKSGQEMATLLGRTQGSLYARMRALKERQPLEVAS